MKDPCESTDPSFGDSNPQNPGCEVGMNLSSKNTSDSNCLGMSPPPPFGPDIALIEDLAVLGRESEGDMATQIDIFSYSNYRTLLRDFYNQEKRQSSKHFSYRYLSRKLGFKSPNLVKRIIDGERGLTYPNVQKMARVMGLKGRKLQFFEALVHFNQTKDPAEKEKAFHRILEFKEYRDSKKLVAEQYEFYSKWYFPVIRELVSLKDFQENPSWICKKLHSLISPVEAKIALETLEKLKLLVRDSQGKLKLADSHISTDEEVTSAALTKFHSHMIDQGKASLKKPVDKRDVSALTMSISPKQFEHIRERVRQMHRDIQKYISEGKGEDPSGTFQLNFQLFELTKQRRGDA